MALTMYVMESRSVVAARACRTLAYGEQARTDAASLHGPRGRTGGGGTLHTRKSRHRRQEAQSDAHGAYRHQTQTHSEDAWRTGVLPRRH
jgi:hypothetical protein